MGRQSWLVGSWQNRAFETRLAERWKGQVTVSKVTFVLLSFEGPDLYSRAGGLGSRVTELATTLAAMGFETHLFFIGDPNLPGHELLVSDRLQLHRWCQWISRYHPTGVYDGEEGKLYDWERSLPGWLEKEVLEPRIAAGGSVVVMGEEWQTTNSMVAIHRAALQRGWRNQVRLLWNANNTFSFHRIDWEGLKEAANITTVSRYMKHAMWSYGVDARVIPNGISESWLQPNNQKPNSHLARLSRGRMLLVKVARWDPDKRWNMAVDSVSEMKSRGLEPMLLARGGVEGHRQEVLARARDRGLSVVPAHWRGEDAGSLFEAISPAAGADIVDLEGFLSQTQRKVLFRIAHAVLANSGIEPFGLVGLETMAAGGVAFVGCTGEDYATPGHDSVSIQTNDPMEIVHHAAYLRSSPEVAHRLRLAAQRTAERYTWVAVIQRVLIPLLQELGVDIGTQAEGPAPGSPMPLSWRDTIAMQSTAQATHRAPALVANSA